jgi:hypothetical protein
MARLSQYGLRRVLGTSALFSTAYGDVGSSPHYGLGIAPTRRDFLVAIPVAMIAYKGIETISNMADQPRSGARWRG